MRKSKKEKMVLQNKVTNQRRTSIVNSIRMMKMMKKISMVNNIAYTD